MYYFWPLTELVVSHATSAETALLLHQRLGHPSSQPMSFISPLSKNSNIKKILDSCDICFLAKQTRAMFPLSENKAASLFDLVHCDLWGPYPINFFTGSH